MVDNPNFFANSALDGSTRISPSGNTIVGIILARDLWKAHRDGVEEIKSITRPIQFSPATKPVDDLISEMRRERVKMVIVVDEFGGTAGLVTLEDAVETLLGLEIVDEMDETVDMQALARRLEESIRP